MSNGSSNLYAVPRVASVDLQVDEPVQNVEICPYVVLERGPKQFFVDYPHIQYSWYRENEDADEWPLVSRERNYTPTQADVGKRLRLRIDVHPDTMTLMSGDAAGALLPQSHTEETSPILPLPELSRPRPMRVIRPFDESREPDKRLLRILSYNILAPRYCDTATYPYCLRAFLSWPYRRRSVCNELLGYRGDIVCLQEVQRNAYEDEFRPMMEKVGYDGLYKQKSGGTSRQSDGTIHDNRSLDGCALFYRRDQFTVLHNYSFDVEFSDLAVRQFTDGNSSNSTTNSTTSNTTNSTTNGTNSGGNGVGGAAGISLSLSGANGAAGGGHNNNAAAGYGGGGVNGAGNNINGMGGGNGEGGESEMSRQQLSRLNRFAKHHVAQLVLFLCKKGPMRNQLLLVVNTHLHWDPLFADVKAWQCHQVVLQIYRVLIGLKRVVPVVICGDFNSSDKSAVYSLLTTGMIGRDHPDNSMDTHGVLPQCDMVHRDILSSLPDRLDPDVRTRMPASPAALLFHSAYRTASGAADCEPPFTNYTAQFQGCLDYVFYNRSGKLEVSAVLEPLSPSECAEEGGGLPNSKWPSDHMALITDFVWSR